MILFFELKDIARTNNVAEGWHNAFATTTGCQRPVFYKFIDALKTDENISRGKMVECEAGHDPPPKKPKYIKRDRAIKTSILAYLKARVQNDVQPEANVNSSDDEEEGEKDENAILVERKNQWQKSPAFTLLKAIAHNT